MQEHPVYAEVLNHYLSLATIVGIVLVLVCVLFMAYCSYTKSLHTFKIVRILGEYIYPIGFFVSFGGMAMSLFYSEVLHYVPCDLCWFQRIFLYPQVFLFAYAWWKKDRAVLPYTLILSVIGLVIATYHHLLQVGYDLMKPCSSAPFAVDCAKPSFIEFGFVTFPFMAVVLFGFLTTLLITALHLKKKA